MLDFSRPDTWLWLVSVIAFTFLLFRKEALLLLSVILPVVFAIKHDVHTLIISAGVSAVLVAVIFGGFLSENRTDKQTATLADDETGQAVAFRFRIPFMLAALITLVLNIALAFLVLQFFDPDIWFEQDQIAVRAGAIFYLIASFISALCLFTIFVSTAVKPSSKKREKT